MAREAGVSTATVSFALNGNGRVGDETRRRVIEVARRLDYRVDPVGRALRVGKSRTLGLLLPTHGPAGMPLDPTSITFYSEFAAGAAEAAFQHTYALVLLPPPTSATDLDRFALDGLLVCDPVHEDARLAMAEALHLPVVCVEPEPGQRDDRPGGSVGADNAANARSLLDHLAEQGASRIALLAPQMQWAWANETADEYLRWCVNAGNEPMVVDSRDAKALARVLDAQRPDGILALTEYTATNVMRLARDRSFRVPEDLLVAAGVDGALAQHHEPPITAMDLLPRRQARFAVDRLLALGAGEAIGPSIRLAGELRVRQSSQPEHNSRSGRPGRAAGRPAAGETI